MPARIALVCKILGCGRKHFSKELCRTHHGQLPEVKEQALSYRQSEEAKAKRKAAYAEWLNKPGVRERRRAAESARKKTPEGRAKEKAKRQSPAAKRGAWHANLRKVGFTPEMYRARVEEQGGLCPICKRELNQSERKPPADHCHATGTPRAVLCNPCNIGLGAFRDDLDSLRNAIVYLEYWSAACQTERTDGG
jgi:hypothetical protein